jgi:gamma-glutamyl:cysteine ligase YbdK (ATP-grasp superfamily)
LAASSPFLDGQATGYLDSRLSVYRTNCQRLPSITGQVIPEPVFTRRDYQTQILQRMYDDIAPLDPEGVLQDEWLNARGAIARFDRQTIEIRLLDVQETPQADVAIAAAVSSVLRALVAERWTDLAFQQSFSTGSLESLLSETIERAEQAIVNNADYLRAFGLKERSYSAGKWWREVLAGTLPVSAPEQASLEMILNQGSLASRILRATGKRPSRERLRAVYRELCGCLAQGRLFHG